MNQSFVSRRVLICLAFPLLTIVVSLLCPSVLLAESILLIEMKNFGNCFDCQPDRLQFDFEANGDSGNGILQADWSLSAIPADVGQTFAVPTQLLSDFDAALTVPNELSVITAFSGFGGSRDVRISGSAQFTAGTVNDVPSIVRFVPILGKNLFGYNITNITQTIDAVTITPISFNSYSIRGDHTIRIFGQPIPEPTAYILGIVGLVTAYCGLVVRLTRR